MERREHDLREVARLASLALLVAVVVRELRLPRHQRTWHGRLLGVPYDLRPPTWQRLRRAWWAPEDARIVTPRALGVGWSLNLGRIVSVLRAVAASSRTRQPGEDPR